MVQKLRCKIILLGVQWSQLVALCLGGFHNMMDHSVQAQYELGRLLGKEMEHHNQQRAQDFDP